MLFLVGATGCLGADDRSAATDPPALDPPLKNLTPEGAPSAGIVLYVQNHAQDTLHLTVTLDDERILTATIPSSVNVSGHPPVHRFRYRIAAGDHRLTVQAGGQTRTVAVHSPNTAARWLVVQRYDDLPLEADVFEQRPQFG